MRVLSPPHYFRGPTRRWVSAIYTHIHTHILLACRLLGNIPGIIWNWPMQSEERTLQVGRWQFLINKGNFYIQGLSLVAARLADLSTYPPTLTSLCRGFNWVQSHVLSRRSLKHITISRLCPWSGFWEWGRQMEPIFWGQGRGSGASDCQGPAQGSIRSPIFSTITPNTPMHTSVPKTKRRGSRD